MAEAFVRTLKRDYARVNPRCDAQTVIEQLPGWLAYYNLAHYNEVHPHRALATDHPASTSRKPARTRQAFKGQQHEGCAMPSEEKGG